MTLIAVPYYGTLSLPPSGLTRIYFMAEVDVERRTIVKISLQVWDPKKEPNLFVWLGQMETNGLICSDAPSNYAIALHAEGIWVQWGQDGEVHEVIENWMHGPKDQAKALSSRTSDPSRSAYTMEPVWDAG